MALTTSLQAIFQATHTAVLDLSTVTANVAKTITLALANGTGANQADLLWHDERTLTTGANEDLDLAGVLTSPLPGSALTFARVKTLIFYAASANSTILTVGPKASNGFAFLGGTTPTFALVPSGLFILHNPSATALVVTATTADLINVLNASGASATYGVIIAGASA